MKENENIPSPAEPRGDEGEALTFDMLREANRRRLPQFKNKHGERAHSRDDGSDWSPAQWLQAATGELGEYANIRKKFERGDLTAEEFQREAADELADVVTYLDILAFQLRIDLGAAVASKFNRISERVGANVRLPLAALRSPQADEPVFYEESEWSKENGNAPQADDERERLADWFEGAIKSREGHWIDDMYPETNEKFAAAARLLRGPSAALSANPSALREQPKGEQDAEVVRLFEKVGNLTEALRKAIAEGGRLMEENAALHSGSPEAEPGIEGSSANLTGAPVDRSAWEARAAEPEGERIEGWITYPKDPGGDIVFRQWAPAPGESERVTIIVHPSEAGASPEAKP